jgi:hypothetical protein
MRTAKKVDMLIIAIMALLTEPIYPQCASMSPSRQPVIAGRFAVACVMLLSFPAVRAGAQAPASAPWGLFSARYDTRTSDFIYALYGYGQSFAMVGTLQNPRSGWTELVGAVGRTFAPGGGPAHSVATGVARASDGWYAQVYYVPTVAAGSMRLRATAECDVPLSGKGVSQFALSPLSLTTVLLPFLEAGMSMDLGAARGGRTSVAIGPELRVSIPGATIGSDLQRMADGSASRARLFFSTQF